MATSLQSLSQAAMTFTLPREYRPHYLDHLLQSSSEQRPLQLTEASGGFGYPYHPAKTAKTLPLTVPPYSRKRIPISMLYDAPAGQNVGTLSHSPPDAWEKLPFSTMGPAQADPSFTGPLPPGLNIGFVKMPRLLRSCASYMDFFTPHVTSHGLGQSVSDNGPLFEVCTIWRGLTVAGARELFLWSYSYDELRWKWGDISVGPITLSSIASELVYRMHLVTSPNSQTYLQSSLHLSLERFLSMSTSSPSLQLLEPKAPVVGQLYVLTPHVSSLPGFSAVCWSNAEWFIYDRSQHRFQGVIPPCCPRYISVTVKVTNFLDATRAIEHTIRTRVYLHVSLPQSPNESTASTSCVVYKPSKRVSFVDSDSESQSSSASHLKPFFDSLAAMTYDPTYVPPREQKSRQYPGPSHNDTGDGHKNDDTKTCQPQGSDDPPAHDEPGYYPLPEVDSDAESVTSWHVHINGPVTISPDLTMRPADSNTVKVLEKYRWKGWEREAAMKSKAKVQVDDDTSSDEPCTDSDPEARGRLLVRHFDRQQDSDHSQTGKDTHALQKPGRNSDSSNISNATNAAELSQDGSAESADILTAAPETAQSSETLFDTVRNQFLKEHQSRQSSARVNRIQAKRAGLHQLFLEKDGPSSFGNTDSSPADVLAGDLALADGDADSELSDDSLQMENITDSDAEAIAAAVKRSFDAEIQGEDHRDELEIRKGMLMHDVMNLEEAKQRRQFGSSNYEDLFQSNGSGNPAPSSSS